MDLLKKNIRLLRENGSTTDQMTLEEDCIVPDSLPDASKIVWKKAMLNVDEIQTEDSRITLNGQWKVQILYQDDTQEHRIHRLEETIPFQESRMLEGKVGKENVQVGWELEDITVSLINSRKVSIRGLITFVFHLEESKEIQAAVELHGIADVSIQTKELELLELKNCKKDIYRLKESLTLPSSKSTIRTILWDSVQLRGIEVRPEDGKLSIRGELFLFLLYEGEEEQAGLQWLESAIPFQGNLDCPGAGADLVSQVEVQMEHCSIEASEDYDGEKRQLSIEAALGMAIHLYEEERAEILTDVYSPVKELVPDREISQYESLVAKRGFRIKAGGKGRLTATQPRILQVCSSVGTVKMDDVRITEEGLMLEGAVMVQVLYLSSDDKNPYAVMEAAVPFQQLASMEQLDEHCRFRIQNHLEQLGVNMLDSETAEIKATVAMELFVVKEQQEAFITDIEIKEMDLRKIQEMPGIVGYIVQPGDTLWSIAKRYYTTPERICQLNQIEEKEVRPGIGLIIVKTVLLN